MMMPNDVLVIVILYIMNDILATCAYNQLSSIYHNLLNALHGTIPFCNLCILKYQCFFALFIRDSSNPNPQFVIRKPPFFSINYQESESAISVRILIRIQNLESAISQSVQIFNFYYIIGRQILLNFFSVLGMLPWSTRRNFISGFYST